MNDLIILRGKSGSGKTKVSNLLKEHLNLPRVTPYTTRQKRENEYDGNPYHFISESEMSQLLKKAEKENIILSETTYGDGKYLALTSDLPQLSQITVNDNGIERILTQHRETINPVLIRLTGCHINDPTRTNRDKGMLYLPNSIFHYTINNKDTSIEELEEQTLELFIQRILPKLEEQRYKRITNNLAYQKLCINE